MDEQVLGGQQEPIYNSSVLIKDVAWKTCRERWTIGTNGERVTGKSVLAARHNDDDIYNGWNLTLKAPLIRKIITGNQYTKI